MDKITTAKAGQTMRMKNPQGGRYQVTIGAACADKNHGLWHCITHSESFENQLQKDIHIGRGTHRLVWICYTHGAEQP